MIRPIRYKDLFGIVLYGLFTGSGPIRILIHLDLLTILIRFLIMLMIARNYVSILCENPLCPSFMVISNEQFERSDFLDETMAVIIRLQKDLFRGRKPVDMYPKSDSIATYSRQKLGYLLFVREVEEEESVSKRQEEVRTPASISADTEDLEANSSSPSPSCLRFRRRRRRG